MDPRMEQSFDCFSAGILTAWMGLAWPHRALVVLEGLRCCDEGKEPAFCAGFVAAALPEQSLGMAEEQPPRAGSLQHIMQESILCTMAEPSPILLTPTSHISQCCSGFFLQEQPQGSQPVPIRRCSTIPPSLQVPHM